MAVVKLRRDETTVHDVAEVYDRGTKLCDARGEKNPGPTGLLPLVGPEGILLLPFVLVPEKSEEMRLRQAPASTQTSIVA